MRYNYQNVDQLNDVYLHDSEFDGYRYHYLMDMRHIVELSCISHWPVHKKYSLRFLNVAYQEMQAFTLWAGGNAIMWVEAACTSEQEIQSILDVEKTQSNANSWNTAKIKSAVPLITVSIRLNSGDRMRIICESLEITEERIM